MKKSMYSLMLMSDIVQKIDQVAAREGLSRSEMVNRILADFLSFTTPQKRFEEIFSQISETIIKSDVLRVFQQSNSILLLKTSLNYPYNPTIRYSVELGLGNGGYFCEFKAATRSKSDALLSLLTAFFEMWCQIERYMLRDRAGTAPHGRISGGGFSRRMLVQADGQLADSAALGHSIGSYICMFDTALRLCLSAQNIDMQTFERITGLYGEYVKNCDLPV